MTFGEYLATLGCQAYPVGSTHIQNSFPALSLALPTCACDGKGRTRLSKRAWKTRECHKLWKKVDSQQLSFCGF